MQIAIIVYLAFGGIWFLYGLGYVLQMATQENRGLTRREILGLILIPVFWFPLVIMAIGAGVASKGKP